MPTTVKRISLSLTRGDIRDLDELTAHFQETSTQVVKRALLMLQYVTFMNAEKQNYLEKFNK
jgi:hypothetical protein